jgi:hypothetical protein
VLGRAGDISKRYPSWHRSEFEIYGYLERAYSSEKLAWHITLQCYGAFESKRLDALPLDSALSRWDDLMSASSEWISVAHLSPSYCGMSSRFHSMQHAELISSNDRHVVSYMFRGNSFIVHYCAVTNV